MAGHLAPGQASLSGHVVETGDASPGDMEERTHDVVLLDELQQGIEPEDGGAERA